MPESLNLDRGRGDVTWVDVDLSDPDARSWLASRTDLGEACRDALLEDPKISRRDAFEDALCVSLCGFDMEQPPDRDAPTWVRIHLQAGRVLTVRPGPLVAVDAVRAQVRRGNGPTTSLGVLAAVVVSAARYFEPMIARLSEETDQLEDAVLLPDEDPPLAAVDALRRRVFRARHVVVAVHNVLRLTIADPTIAATPEERESLRDASELVGRHVENLIDCRDRAQLLHDKVTGQIAQNMAQATFNLTIVATVFLPLSFVTGLLGMNVSGIPEAHDPSGFWVVVGALAVLALSAWGFLRWKRRLIFG